ncbi:MAG: PIN domain-containing protein [Bryobacteraceae bacterium]
MNFVLDTCVLVAAVRSRNGASFVIVDLASTGKIKTVLSTSLVSQYEDVLFRPEHRVDGWTDEDLFALVDSLLVPAQRVQTNFSCRPSLQDAGDELVLEAAIAGRAHIVTFDIRHFKPAARFGVRLFKPAEVLRLYQGGLS